MDRVDYIKARLEELIHGKERAYLVTTLRHEDENEEDKAGVLCIVDLGGKVVKDSPYPIIEEVDAIDFDWHVAFSLRCKWEYRMGDENALFDFCKVDDLAFRESWVVNQIESWRRENTRESIGNLRKLMKKYTFARGKSFRDGMRKGLKRDKGIYIKIASMKAEDPALSLIDCFEKVSNDVPHNGIFLGTESVRKIYWNFKKIEKLIETILFKYRGRVVSKQLESTPPAKIDQLLKDVFLLDKIIVLSWGKELFLYKQMRLLLYKNLKYVPDGGLRRDNAAEVKRPGNGYEDVFKKIAEREKESLSYAIDALGYTMGAKDYVRKLYIDYRYWEAVQNDENPEEKLAEEGFDMSVLKRGPL